MVFEAFALATLSLTTAYAAASVKDLHRFGEPLAACQLLAVTLGLSILCRIAAPPGGFGNMVWLSVGDLTALLLSLAGCWTKFAWWKLVFCLTFLADLAAHAGFWWAWQQGHDARYTYVLTLNALYIVAMAASAWPGAEHVARRANHGLHVRRLGAVRIHHGASR